ncbi:hypothetical protein TSMEX_000825 [Taenia solium]|eukprot:TsM_000425000 transcript=TsM_000425000 gene=TsM_000425000
MCPVNKRDWGYWPGREVSPPGDDEMVDHVTVIGNVRHCLRCYSFGSLES